MAYSEEPEFVTVNVHVHRVKQKAVFLSNDGEDRNAKWILLSEIRMMGSLTEGDETTIEIARWVAKREGFIWRAHLVGVNQRVAAATQKMRGRGTTVIYKVQFMDDSQFFTDDPDIDSQFGGNIKGVMVMQLSSGVFITGNAA